MVNVLNAASYMNNNNKSIKIWLKKISALGKIRMRERKIEKKIQIHIKLIEHIYSKQTKKKHKYFKFNRQTMPLIYCYAMQYCQMVQSSESVKENECDMEVE